ncbi:MAG: phosphate ABC transporter substrate-binding protein [Planctomycetota bacterium]|nr:phosphate ABC transporter substrate-binding protein [Planctomycetota bacterium]
MKRIIICAVIMAVLAAAMELFGAESTENGQPSQKTEKTLLIEGSTTVGPIADAFTEVFNKTYPDVKITVTKNGSGNGAAALVDSRCDIAMLSRFMKPEEFKSAVDKGSMPVAHVIAMDGVCIIVHPSNTVTELTTSKIREIYFGKIKNWKELGGPDMPIVVISRDTSSGTYETFDHFVMKKEKMAGGVEYVNSNPQIHTRVKTTQGAIGYVGVGFLDADVKGLKVDGVMPSKETIASGVYSLSRPLFLFTNGYPALGSVTYKFCTFYLTEKGQEIIEAKGFVPVTHY